MVPKNLSRSVQSNQPGVHPRLGDLLNTHLASPWMQPLHAPTVGAFELLEKTGIITGPERIVLDSGCGTGESTRLMARAWPDCLVLGVDKSISRLSRLGTESFPYREDNAVWLRADLTTFWRLALKAGWRLHRHYLLYPNPWPKAGQLQRRWHAHPVFPDMLRLGGRLEMRCNWGIYAQEFAMAVNQVLGTDVRPADSAGSPISSPFERKYRRSGQRLYSVVVSCVSSAVK